MKRNIINTGANRGIGLELAKQYSSSGDYVFAICRVSSKELDTLDNTTVIEKINLTNSNDLKNLKEKLKSVSIDLLINNAGIMKEERLGEIDFEKVEDQFQINTLVPLKLSEMFMDQMITGSKIALITSRMGSLNDNGSGGFYGYRISKAALNIVGISLSVDLKEKGIAVGLLHPGYVQTDLFDKQGDISPSEAANRLRKRIVELNLKNTGTFRHSNGEYLPW